MSVSLMRFLRFQRQMELWEIMDPEIMDATVAREQFAVAHRMLRELMASASADSASTSLILRIRRWIKS